MESVKRNNLLLLKYLIAKLVIVRTDFWVIGCIGEIFKRDSEQDNWMVILPVLKVLVKVAIESYHFSPRHIITHPFIGLEYLGQETLDACKDFVRQVIRNEI
ncbi:MAG: hypothetical protein EOP45_16485 [Sphingobacteriaceae bacterium]|nr:MAG: hypothetical protein EOP45_16485 [Sphingobacteriaceae bacterium]